MNQDMLRIIDSIARDRNVDKESLFTDIEMAMVSAARKHFNALDTEEFTCEVDRMTGAIRVFRGEQEIPMAQLGRIPAQTAKQVMIQKFREDERASIYDEYSKRVGEVLTGTAQRYEGGALVASIGRAEGFMPRSEQIPGEQHQPGERVRCMIVDVREESSQVKIVLSRSHPDFVRRLFEVEVPEVSERIIEIKALAREAGHRTKVAVSSIDSKVDAVGACVGVRGSRIKNIVDELGGEKVDIVRYNESSQVLIANALRPAEVVDISLCFELGRATVVVNEDQLSLAIGKRGQNVRLAARLTGWDVDILTPAEYSKGLDTLEETIKTVEGVTEEMIDRMGALGLISVFDLEEIGPEVLAEQLEELGMTEEIAGRACEQVSETAKEVAEQQQREKEAEEQRRAETAALPEEQQAETVLGDLLGGGAGTAEGEGPAEGAEPATPAASDEGGSDIVNMLLSSRQGEQSAEGGETAEAGEAKAEGEAEGPTAPPTPTSPSPEDLPGPETKPEVVLGGGYRRSTPPSEAAEDPGADEAVHDAVDETDSDAGDQSDEPRDVTLAEAEASESQTPPTSEGEEDIERSQDETDVARLAQGDEPELDADQPDQQEQREVRRADEESA